MIINSMIQKSFVRKGGMRWLMLFTFLVPALFARDQFPNQFQSQPLPGYISSDKFDLLVKTNSDVNVRDLQGRSLIIPRNTTLEMETSFFDMLDRYSPNKAQSQDDIFLNDVIQQFSIMKYFESIEAKQVESSGIESERKSQKQKIKIKDSIDKKLLEKKELVVDIELEDASKFEVIEQQESLPITIESDYDGDSQWDPSVEEEVKDPKTQATSSKYCKKCQAHKANDLPDVAKDIELQAAANKVNSLFAELNLPMDIKNKQKLNAAIDFAKKNKEEKSTGYCYKYTKAALLAAGLTNPRLNGRYAKQAGPELEKQGFVNLLDSQQVSRTRLGKENMNDLLKSPYLAPKGAILVYEPNPKERIVRVCTKKKSDIKKCYWDQDAGHIEIKTAEAGSAGFVSDYYNERSRTGHKMSTSDRKLVGIYYKL